MNKRYICTDDKSTNHKLSPEVYSIASLPCDDVYHSINVIKRMASGDVRLFKYCVNIYEEYL